MPHIIIECSKNVDLGDDFPRICNEIHSILSEGLPTQISSCKSRLFIADHAFIGDGDENHAFIHITIKVLPGRTLDKKRQLTQKIHQSVLNLFNVQLSVEMIDLDETYIK